MNLLHLLAQFPLGYHARNCLGGGRSSAAFWIRSGSSVSALVSGKKGAVFEQNLERMSGAPLPLAQPSRKNAFFEEFLTPRRLAPDGQFVFVVDQPDAVVSLVQTKKLGMETVEQLRKSPVEMLLPVATPPEGFTWEILASDFSALPAQGSLPDSLLITGLPSKIAWWAEKWTETLDATLLGVVPSLIAELLWCQKQGNGFFLLPGLPQSTVALFMNGRLQLLMRVPAPERLFGSFLEPMLEEIRSELGAPESPLQISSHRMSRESLGTLLSRFRKPAQAIQPEAAAREEFPEEAAILQTTLQTLAL